MVDYFEIYIHAFLMFDIHEKYRFLYRDKGQTISKANYGFLNSPKKTNDSHNHNQIY